jgi:hypothetical protein
MALPVVRHAIRLLPFLPLHRPGVVGAAPGVGWVDRIASTVKGVVGIGGACSLILTSAVAWVIVRNPELFINRMFDTVERISIHAIDSGSVLLVLETPKESSFPPIPLAKAEKNASGFLSLVLGYEVVTVLEVKDVPEKLSHRSAVITPGMVRILSKFDDSGRYLLLLVVH